MIATITLTMLVVLAACEQKPASLQPPIQRSVEAESIAPPDSTTIATISSVLRSADSIQVARLTTEFPQGFASVDTAPAGWGGQLTDVLERQVFPMSKFKWSVATLEGQLSSSAFQIQAKSSGSSVVLRMGFELHQLDGTVNGTLFNPVRIDSAEVRLLAMMREALPQDSDLARARPGAYVYVEELPERIKQPAPSYPPSARKHGIEGTVLLQALVGKDGLIKETRVVKSIPELDAAAVESVRRWKFKPARSRGAPVAVWVAIPVKFTLR